MLRTAYLIIILFLVNTVLFAQQFTLSGTIQDESGQPVPFASVFLKNTTHGTSANINGKYIFKLDKGKYTISYRAIGFKTKEVLINLTDDQTHNITLKAENYALENVTIHGNAEDPAYAIIRHAIEKRKEHLTEVNAYECDVYIKGVQKLNGAPKKFLGRNIQKTLDLDTNRKGIIYLSESESKFSFQRPDKIHEEMISSKLSGRNNAFSFNKASDLMIDLYENIVLENNLSARGFVSPIADNALFYYSYKLLGELHEGGETIHKIEVIARRENDPVFRGIIYILDKSWRIYNADLFLLKKAGINFVDTLSMNLSYTKVKEVYMPTNVNLEFSGNLLGFKFAGYYLASYSNYNLNPKFPKNYFNGEILKITEFVNKKDSLYWKNNRPIPLTLEEKLDYVKKDSIAKLKESKHYLDSVENANNKFAINKLLLTPYSINKRYEKKFYTFDPILRSIFYNTVEGLAIKYGVTYRKEFENRVNYTIRPEIRYGLAINKFTGSLTGNYHYNPKKKANVGISFGNGIFDLNNVGSMTLFGNSINSLFYGKNFLKFYEKNYLKVYSSRELTSGLQASIGMEYNQNKTLVNHTDFYLINTKDLAFTSNNPFTPEVETPLFPTYKAFTLNASLTYSIGQHYITRPDGKFYTESKYPQITLSYSKGLKNTLSSDIDYDFLKLEVYQEKINFGLWGYSTFLVGVGGFPNNNKMYFPDYKHFAGNISTIFPPNIRKFQYLDFYQFSTREKYFEAHLEHSFGGFFINKVPLLRKTKLEEFIGGGYLSSPEKKNYKEFYFGLKRLIFRASYGFAYDGSKKIAQSIRFSYGF
ncbi:DUF5686 and carboxypeptidase regulatory-like domain-containing protein [Pedobacter sp. MW01-1-1]|uniref:DUF5686 and carboxypeptidase regulatory-like domain-containing protein n=1 Tax=Pedobacter sp. MW01-1-1 TaxID=3383027 RepID=UPI003FEF8E5B